ncbi:MAG: lysylphosphatidylglycerol synthetase family protein [Phycisphaerales bacterium]|nr:lysylphosphatidylglycerol synthetase family protein [Phycisphaerales bacterium]
MEWARSWQFISWIVKLLLPALVVTLAWREVHDLNVHHVRAVLGDANLQRAGFGALLAFAAVFVMGLYDAFAFPRGAMGTMTFPRRWLLGCILFGWTNFIAMGPFGGPALRILAYRRFGLTAAEITRGFVAHYIASASGLAAWLLGMWVPLPAPIGTFWGRALLALPCAMLLAHVAGMVARHIAQRRQTTVDLARMPLGALAIVTFFDWGLTILSFSLLTSSVGISLALTDAARTVLTGQFAGLVSMVPGGIGSADAVWFKGFALLGIPTATAAGGVMIFRAGYYALPWIASLIATLIALSRMHERVRLWQRRIIAGAVMLNAILLLMSAATPAVRSRLDALDEIAPLGAIEVSHAVATIAAAIMLFLVRGLTRGYRSAHMFTSALLVASALAHPLKGGDYEESFVSVVLLVLLVSMRAAFPRRGRIPIGWELTIAAAVGSVSFFLVVGLATFEHIPYHHDLWLHFAQKAEASRFLRALLLLVLVALAFILRQAMRPARLWINPTESDIVRAATFAKAHAAHADALLVGAGDKGLWFHEPTPGKLDGLALIQRHGDQLIVFRDPILAPGASPSLFIDAFLHHAEALDVDPVFSMISGQWMEHLHDFGFHFLKMNEEAIVPLTTFSLAGGRNATLRHTMRQVEAAGVTYELCSPPFADALVDQLRHVSDTWLASKRARELQFSACCFSPQYLQRSDLAIARDATGQPVAFANVLATRTGGPATLDLMRHTPDAPDGAMDFLVLNTLRTLAERGASSFSMGAAPLSQVGTWKQSRLIERALHLFSTKAERLYNYQGLRTYKAKFHPQWEPRYLAYQQAWNWASALLAYTRLVQARSRADKARIAAARMGQPTGSPE